MIQRAPTKNFCLILLILSGIIGILFLKSCESSQVLFANDGPLGALTAQSGSMRTAWKGVWQDLNWIGIENPAALPNTAALFWFALGNEPVHFAKFYVPISLVLLGLSLWILLRQFGFRHSVCALGAIAAALNMNSFSHACWGLPSRAITQASMFLALAAIQSGLKGRPYLKAILAGFAVSNGIMEGFDVGAIYSLYVAAFTIFVVLAQPGRITVATVVKAFSRLAVLVVFSVFCAAAALSTLIGTQIQGVAGMQQDQASKQKRWDVATMWSLPVVETTRVLVPGLFGYRMDTPEGGNYWGHVGQTPGNPQSRYSGAGEYAGALVVLLGAFALANAFRKKNNPYSELERKTVLFFGVLVLISLLLAWGRYAPFYHIVYALPYFSTIRNPIKFMHPFHLALLVLFGFGLEAVFRLYSSAIPAKAMGIKAAIKDWWKVAPSFEKRWVQGSLAFWALCVLATLIYMSSRRDLIAHLEKGGFSAGLAQQMATFSYAEAGLAVLFVGLAVSLLACSLSGWFSGRRAKALVVIFGCLIAVDLMRANLPWIIYYNYQERYAPNAVLNFLRDKPYEHRVTAKVAPFGRRYFVSQDTEVFEQAANIWLQNQFQYYNIQALEPVQMPRPPELDERFFMSMLPNSTNPPLVLARMWELSNTRYLLGDKQMISAVLPQLGVSTQDFRILHSFDMALKPGVAQEKATLDDLDWHFRPDGRFAIFDYTDVLPRAVLFPRWEQTTNDQAVLERLTSPEFNPHSLAFLHGVSSIIPGNETNFQGSVTIDQYAPQKIKLSATNNAPALLLYNDKYSSNWKLTVDGKPATLFRANFIMRGIPLPPGSHKIEMNYSQSLTGLYFSIAGIFAGFVVLGFVCFLRPRKVNVPSLEARPPD
jgi:hypothetical protein